MASRSDAASIFNSSELVSLESLEPNGSTHCETDSLVAVGKQVALTALAHETRKLTKRQKAQAKKLSKLRLEGFLLDRSSQKGAVVVSTLVPFSGRRAQHQQRLATRRKQSYEKETRRWEDRLRSGRGRGSG